MLHKLYLGQFFIVKSIPNQASHRKPFYEEQLMWTKNGAPSEATAHLSESQV